MAKKIEKCWNCNKYKADHKDYRQDDQGNINKTFSCRYCVQLNDFLYEAVRKQKLNPKNLFEGA